MELKALEARPPNVVLIFADDLGYGDISCYEPTGVKTPHLDALAAEGFRSTDFFVPANVCSPSRAALLTGRYPMRCGFPVARHGAAAKFKDYGLAPDELTIPEMLKTAGYRSLMVGKWHMGLEVEGSHPLVPGYGGAGCSYRECPFVHYLVKARIRFCGAISSILLMPWLWAVITAMRSSSGNMKIN